MQNGIVVTIQKVVFVGKWAELWFKEKNIAYNILKATNDSYHFSCKIDQLYDAVDKAKLTDKILNTGFKNKRLILQYDGNWNILEIMN